LAVQIPPPTRNPPSTAMARRVADWLVPARPATLQHCACSRIRKFVAGADLVLPAFSCRRPPAAAARSTSRAGGNPLAAATNRSVVGTTPLAAATNRSVVAMTSRWVVGSAQEMRSSARAAASATPLAPARARATVQFRILGEATFRCRAREPGRRETRSVGGSPEAATRPTRRSAPRTRLPARKVRPSGGVETWFVCRH
jgi:hypothetical protein